MNDTPVCFKVGEDEVVLKQGLVVVPGDGRKLDKAVIRPGTICHVTLRSPCAAVAPKTVASGASACHPRDKFDVEKGRKMSLARALETAKMSRTARKAFWATYFGK